MNPARKANRQVNRQPKGAERILSKFPEWEGWLITDNYPLRERN